MRFGRVGRYNAVKKATLKMSSDLETQAPAPALPPKTEHHEIAPQQHGHHAIFEPKHKTPTLQPAPPEPSTPPSSALKPVTYSPFPPSRNGTPTPVGSISAPSRKGTPTPTSAFVVPSRNGTPVPETPGAAQFIANLSHQQRAHLQFAVPTQAESDRLSHFLEEPRQTPVPGRFMFEALDSEARTTKELNSKVRRGDTKKSHFYHKPPTIAGSRKSSRSRRSSRSSRSRSTSHHAREKSTAASASNRTSGTVSARGMSFESIPKSRPRLQTEVRHFKGVALEVDWRFYATGVCLALVNLALAWDSTAISIALPVCSLWVTRISLTRNRPWQ